MKRVAFWLLSIAAWISAAGLAYIGAIFLLFGSMMGARGDIDYAGFSEAKRHAADMQALWISLFGLLPLAVSVFILWFHRRAIRWFLARVGNQ